MNRRSFLKLLSATSIPVPSFVLALPSDEAEVILPAPVVDDQRYIYSIQYASSHSMCIGDVVSDGKIIARLAAATAGLMYDRDMVAALPGMPRFKPGTLSLRMNTPGEMVAVVTSVKDGGGFRVVGGDLTAPNSDQQQEFLVGVMA